RAASIAADRLGEKRIAQLLRTLGEKRVDDVWRLTERRTELIRAEFDTWSRERLDVVIGPPHVVAAMRHRESGDMVMSVGAQFRWTLLNFPAGVVPVTRVRAGEVGRYPLQRERIEKKVNEVDKRSVGLPVGVQVIAKPYEEHKVLAVMQHIETSCRDDDGFPRTPVTPA
ncbi:MAG: amidase family protein, partial [Myxococcota bacterium]